MNKKFVPEIHDLFKLTRLRHDCTKWDDSDHDLFNEHLPTNTLTWKGIIGHHLSDNFEIYPTEPDTLLLHIADSLASAFSREKIEGKGYSFGVHKLWNPTNIEDPRLQTGEEIISLFEFCKKNSPWEEFVRKYKNILKQRAEDAQLGKNVTTLYTHCKLTGQFYRILKSSPECGVTLESQEKEYVKKLRDEKESNWTFCAVRFKFNFPQHPIRARDTNIFKLMENLVLKIYNRYLDNIIFRTSDTLLGIFPQQQQVDEILEWAYKEGFFVETYYIYNCPLKDLEPAPPRESVKRPKRQWKTATNYRLLLPSINPPICEICQLAPATKLWPRDYILETKDFCEKCLNLIITSPIEEIQNLLCSRDREKIDEIIEELKEEMVTENLCEICFSIRKEGTKLKKLESWSKSLSTEKIVWVKIKLDFDLLFENLYQLYQGYLESFNIPLGNEEIRFSIISEFYEDYKEFIIKFKKELFQIFDTACIENILEDLFCIKLGHLSDILEILKRYHKLFKTFFPKFEELDESSLKIALVCANSKYPFFEIWRTVAEARNDVFISLVGRGTMKLRVKDLDSVSEIAKIYPSKSSLYKLSKIAETSKRLAQLTFGTKGRDRDSKTYANLRRILPFGMDFQSILTLANIIGE